MSYVNEIRKLPLHLLAMTLVRLLFVPPIIMLYESQPLATAALLAAFIALDLFDGVAARAIGADNVPRRALDTVVDRLSIWPVYIAVVIAGYLSPFLLLAFAIREVYCGYVGANLLARAGKIVRADWMYRSLNISLACWVVAVPLASQSVLSIAFGLMLVYATVVAHDLRCSASYLVAHPTEVRGDVISASWLRGVRDESGELEVSASPAFIHERFERA